MSLGGIALAIGVLVDAAIVMVENAYRHVSEPRRRRGRSRYEDQPRVVVAAAKQVGRPIFFSLAIIVVSFAPVFLLEAQEGRMFRPLAFTKTFAMVAAALLSITLVPVLMAMLHPRPAAAAGVAEPGVAALRQRSMSRSCGWRCAGDGRRCCSTVAVVPLTVPLIFALGSEFMPPLYEGSLLYMPTSPPGLSITEATRLLQVQDRILREFPEVERVFGTVGRGTTPPITRRWAWSTRPSR